MIFVVRSRFLSLIHSHGVGTHTMHRRTVQVWGRHSNSSFRRHPDPCSATLAHVIIDISSSSSSSILLIILVIRLLVRLMHIQLDHRIYHHFCCPLHDFSPIDPTPASLLFSYSSASPAIRWCARCCWMTRVNLILSLNCFCSALRVLPAPLQISCEFSPPKKEPSAREASLQR